MALRRDIIIFDLDGTLVDSAPDISATLNVILAAEGVDPVPLEDVHSFIGHGARVLLQKGMAARGLDGSEENVNRLHRLFIKHYLDNLSKLSRPFPGLETALENLKIAGATFGVCTNKTLEMSAKLLRELSLQHWFGSLVGGDSAARNKPDPLPLEIAIQSLHGSIDRAVMIGDSMADAATAKAAGVPLIAVTFGYTTVPVSEFGAEAIIDHFDELPAAVQALS